MTILLESAIRATLIATVIALVLFAMRIKTPSVRHAVWAGVVVLMLLLPAWAAWGPRASIPLLPAERSVAVTFLPPPSTARPVSTTPASPVRQDGESASLNPIAAIYVLGVGVFLLRLAIGTIRANRLTSASCVVPVTVGLLHPRIILPDRSRDWPQAQLNAVLAHEGEHVRRRDPLFQWLALLNRAIFWFHPLAWWLERRLSGLAEEACDAAVIARGHDPREYSEYLLDLARSVGRAGTRVEAIGMAMPGIGLQHRIQRMLSGVPSPQISRKRMTMAAAACAISSAIFAAGTLVRAQSADRLQFEVTSIRPYDPGEGRTVVGGLHMDGAQIRAVALSLKDYLSTAYNIKALLISGPGWTESNRFDISATVPAGSTPAQVPEMLQSLLADRFKVKLHKEKKEFPVYALVPGKGPLKLKETPRDLDAEKREAKGTFNNATISIGKGVTISYAGGASFYFGDNRVEVRKLTLSEFSRNMERFADRQIVDMTGLTGAYDFSFEVSQEDSQAMMLRSLVWVGQKLSPQAQQFLDGSSPSALSDALQQVGLKLEPRKAPLDVLVIDSALETPTPN